MRVRFERCCQPPHTICCTCEPALCSCGCKRYGLHVLVCWHCIHLIPIVTCTGSNHAWSCRSCGSVLFAHVHLARLNIMSGSGARHGLVAEARRTCACLWPTVPPAVPSISHSMCPLYLTQWVLGWWCGEANGQWAWCQPMVTICQCFLPQVPLHFLLKPDCTVACCNLGACSCGWLWRVYLGGVCGADVLNV